MSEDADSSEIAANSAGDNFLPASAAATRGAMSWSRPLTCGPRADVPTFGGSKDGLSPRASAS